LLTAVVTTTGTVAVAGPAPVAARRAGIDTTDRAAVQRAWHTMIESRVGVTTRWTGRSSSCRAGRASAQSSRTILDGINFARGLAGLAPVRFRRSLSARAQQAALIMAANGTLSHRVPRSWSCWSRTGAAAAARSNLFYGAPELKP